MATTLRRVVPVSLSIAVVNLSDSGDLVAAVANNKILVWEIVLTNSDPTKSVVFRDGTTALTGAELWASYTGRQGNMPLFETTAGAAFTALCSAATSLQGHIKYSTSPT